MKKISIIISNSQQESFVNLLKTIKSKTDFQNYVVVPDKCSFNAERMIFDVLNVTSVFNVDVLSFNRLASTVLQNQEILSKSKGVLLVNKLLIENANKLQTFNKLVDATGLAENIYETIMQFKSSGITPNEIIINETDSHFNKKLFDIKLIYSLYEKYVKENGLDEANRLIYFTNQIKSSDIIKNSNFYIGMFDSFTYLQLSVIKELIKYANDITISLSANTIKPNSYIYLNENLQKILDICKDNGYDYDIKNINNYKDSEFEFVNNNLFAINLKDKIKSSKYQIVKTDNRTNEILFVAKKIKELVVFNNYKFSDINIGVAGLNDYISEIKNIFNKFTIPYYLDCENKLSENYVSKFILTFCNLYLKNNRIEDVLEFIKSDYVDFSSESKEKFEKYCLKYGINQYKFLSTFKFGKSEECFDEILSIQKFYQQIFENLNKFKTNNFACEFSKVITSLIDQLNIKDKTLKMCEKTYYNAVDRKNLTGALNKIIEVLNNIDDMMGEQIIDFETYYNLLKNGLESQSLSTVPLKVNSIFIGDLNESYFLKQGVMFILNATENSFPICKNDCGIITDKEIEKLETKNLLNPTIKEINKRSKFKVFEILQNFKDSCFVTYSTTANGQEIKASSSLNNLRALFENNIEINDNEYHLQLQEKYGTENAEKIFNGNINEYIKNNINIIKNNEDFNKKNGVLKHINFRSNFAREKQQVENISISKVENYNTCPFKYFCQYELKIKENEVFGMKVLDVGNILHEVAEKFVNLLINTNYDEKSLNDVEKIFNNILSKKEYESFDKESLQIMSLKNEAKDLCKVILYQITKSKFKPTKTEFKFSNFKIDDVMINGIVDRIDEFGDYFNILDYKTGKCSFSFEEIFVGKKLQLIVYIYIIEKLLNKHIFGGFYMPISNGNLGEDDEEFKKYKFLGVFLNNISLIQSLDTSLTAGTSSDIFKAKLTKQNELDKKLEQKSLTNDEFDALKLYAIKMLKKTVNNINNGKMAPSPYYKNCCEYCTYSSVCGYEIDNEGYRDKLSGINKKSFMEVITNDD